MKNQTVPSKKIMDLIKKNNQGIRLDVACGNNKNKGFIGLDIQKLDGVDIVHDIEVVPYPLPSECCSLILASHIVEHICPKKFLNVMNELWRIMKFDGQLAIAAPYGGSPGFQQDPTHCFSEDTEVLTEKGWELIEDVKLGQKVLTLNPETLVPEYRETKGLVNERFVGEMLHFKTKRMDLMTTKNHDLFFKSSGNGRDVWKKERADTFVGKSRKSRVGLGVIGGWQGKNMEYIEIPRVVRGGNNAAKKMPVRFQSKLFMQFLGWYISEGCTDVRVGKQYRILIYQSKEKNGDKYKEIVSLIKNLGFTPNCRDNVVSFSSKDVVSYLKSFGTSCYNKTIPKEIKCLSKSLLSRMLDTLIKGDGTKQSNGKGFIYATVSKQLADDVQEVVLKCGYRSTLYIEKRVGMWAILNGKSYPQVDIFLIGINKPSPVYYASPKKVKYDGRIVCVTVDKYHIIMVRRNGCAMWSGNCNQVNEATWMYFSPAPEHKILYDFYKPKPWKIEKNIWYENGNIEVLLSKAQEVKR